MNPKNEDFICFYREAVIAGHDVTMLPQLRRCGASTSLVITPFDC